MNTIRSLLERHQRLKERIHKFRIPLPRWARILATAFYMSLPIIAGYHIMNKTNVIAVDNVGVNGEKLDRAKYNGNADIAEQRRVLQDILSKAKEIKANQDGQN